MRLVQQARLQFRVSEAFVMPDWYHFQCNMKVIDKLSAPDMFGDAVVGLVLLFPDDFDWSFRGKFGSE